MERKTSLMEAVPDWALMNFVIKHAIHDAAEYEAAKEFYKENASAVSDELVAFCEQKINELDAIKKNAEALHEKFIKEAVF